MYYDKFKEGTLVEVVNGDHFVITITGTVGLIDKEGKFIIVKGSSDDEGSRGVSFYVPHKELREVTTIPIPFSPFTMTFADLESFEAMKSIMHLHNKVADSSYFTELDWTPDSEVVREFMKQMKSDMEAHHAGWSKYVAKGE